MTRETQTLRDWSGAGRDPLAPSTELSCQNVADPGLVVCDSDDSDLEAADPDPPGPEPSGLCPSQMERTAGAH